LEAENLGELAIYKANKCMYKQSIQILRKISRAHTNSCARKKLAMKIKRSKTKKDEIDRHFMPDYQRKVNTKGNGWKKKKRAALSLEILNLYSLKVHTNNAKQKQPGAVIKGNAKQSRIKRILVSTKADISLQPKDR